MGKATTSTAEGGATPVPRTLQPEIEVTAWDPTEENKRAKKHRKPAARSSRRSSSGPSTSPAFRRHEKIASLKGLWNKKLKGKLRTQQKLNDEATRRLRTTELLLLEEEGGLEAEGMEKTYTLPQEAIVEQIDLGTREKILSLDLPFGPYTVDFSRNGRHLLLGGKKGSLSLLDCHSFQPLCDINVKETVRDVKILHNHTMWAAAQKKYVYIYDQQGIELHCLRDHMMTYRMDFLPYHYLLVSIGEFGELIYRDISTGQVAARHKTRRGACDCMRQNPSNAVVHLGHIKGTVSLWTPNLAKPAVELLCHNGRVTSLDVHRDYMVTAGVDGSWKIWDLRTYKALHTFKYFGSPPSSARWSQTGMLGLGFGPHVQIWKGAWSTAKPRAPYLTQDFISQQVESLAFRPFEDMCAVGLTGGIDTVVVPQAGKANFDTFEANPYETASQRREREIHSLLEKLQPDMITVDKSSRVGAIDSAPRAVISEEKEREMSERAALKKTKKKTKQRGKSTAAKLQKKATLQYSQKIRDLTAKRLEREKSAEKESKHAANKAAGSFSALDRFRNREKASYG
ncbi:BING4CT domain-containing protein [Besnoitia besnoiti]|uniref:BING4CT domain-containing protein n=1 Tax=Besnoitia besnoiti TaxID=94643 RepID=A0A2A9MCE2_BESBE|nr:BING4CT domain-containing protein [Besnoitia besnoiti]PFH35539.1 BING4CT domain-containing protein [Besnoitia besnoiti]